MNRIFLIIFIILLLALIIWIIKLNYSNDLFRIGDVLTSNPEELQKISQYKFYVLVIEKKKSYLGSYIPFSDIIKTTGGLIEVVKNDNSSIIITDRSAKIIGIYPNKKPSDLVSILENHPDLIDFSLIKTAF